MPPQLFNHRQGGLLAILLSLATIVALSAQSSARPGLSVGWAGTNLVLTYTLQSTQGLMNIYQSDRADRVFTNGAVLYTGPIPSSQQGSLVLTNWRAYQARFYGLAEFPRSEEPPPANPDPNQLVWIAAGTFMMGSLMSEEGRRPNEGPRHQVTLSRGFFMGRYEVTQGQFLALMGQNPSRFTGDLNRPVERVSWNDAQQYCAKLTQQERLAGRLPAGFVYRLPTESEWEYAARAGTTTRFYYGDDPGYAILPFYAWFADNAGRTTHPVGTRITNPWGLYDMHGNVWEWCSDWFAQFSTASLTDPKGPVTGSLRVIRGGGALVDNGGGCRSAVRDSAMPPSQYDDQGFRVVLGRE